MSEVSLAQELVKTKQEVVDVKNKLIDSQDRLQACLLDHKKTLEELVEVREVLKWSTDNVWLQRWPERSHEERWTAYPLGISKWHNAPTLYDALHQAWVARDTTKDL